MNSYRLDSPGYINANVNFYKPGASQQTSEYASVGRLRLSVTESGKTHEISTYCIDVEHWLNAPGSYIVDSWPTTGMGTTQQNQITALLAHVDPISTAHPSQVTDADHSAAVQMAIWEIQNETSGSYDVAQGTFSVTGGGLTNAQNLANGYLANLSGGNPTWTATNGSHLSLRELDGVNLNQSQLAAAVPETQTWAMMVIGFGAIGGTLRRSRRATRLAAA